MRYWQIYLHAHKAQAATGQPGGVEKVYVNE